MRKDPKDTGRSGWLVVYLLYSSRTDLWVTNHLLVKYSMFLDLVTITDSLNIRFSCIGCLSVVLSFADLVKVDAVLFSCQKFHTCSFFSALNIGRPPLFELVIP